MRKRELVSVRWEVRNAEGHVLFMRGNLGDARDVFSDARLTPGKSKIVRITRYRLAPLVDATIANGVWAVYWHEGDGTFCVDAKACCITGPGGRPEAEAALALLGFRVAK